VINIRDITDTISIGLLDLKAFSISTGLAQKREQEKAGANYLLTHLLKSETFELEYTLHNKPFLKNRTEHISISHSHDKLAIIINTLENTGIDIELMRDNVLKIRHKFLNDAEAAFTGDIIENLITFWAAKEVLYKIYGLKNLDFKANLLVEEMNNDTCIGKIETTDFKKKYCLKKEIIENYVLVYALNEV
jgi:phosphopantetheinyl transferase (holo-ACP synthase)